VPEGRLRPPIHRRSTGRLETIKHSAIPFLRRRRVGERWLCPEHAEDLRVRMARDKSAPTELAPVDEPPLIPEATAAPDNAVPIRAPVPVPVPGCSALHARRGSGDLFLAAVRRPGRNPARAAPSAGGVRLGKGRHCPARRLSLLRPAPVESREIRAQSEGGEGREDVDERMRPQARCRR
jgi:hypothetical protein